MEKIAIRDKNYASINDVALDLGVSVKSVQRAIRTGKTETLGLGTGLPMRITIRGQTYESVEEAALALGVKPSTVHSAMTRGNIDSVGLGIKGRKRPKGSGRPGKKLIVAGRKFESIADLARLIGRPPRSVRVSLEKGDLAKHRIAVAVMRVIAKEEQLERRKREKELEQSVKPQQPIS